jgi:hypothetical protein
MDGGIAFSFANPCLTDAASGLVLASALREPIATLG